MGRWRSSTTRSGSAALTSRSPSPEHEPLTPVPNVPPEQDAPGPPEEISVTVVDSRTPAGLRGVRKAAAAGPHSGNGIAAAPAAPAPAAAASGRDPQVRLETLFDPGTLELLHPADGGGMLAGTGLISGIQTVAFASDPRVQGGAMGIEGCQAVVAAYDLAIDTGSPIIGLWHSGGARLAEGVESLHAVGIVFAAMTRASGKVPQISVVLGAAAGGAAYGPALTDLVILSDQGRIFVTGPDVVRSVTGEDVDMERFGGPEPHSRRSGVVHIVTATDADAFDQARQLVELFGQQVTTSDTSLPDADLSALLPENPRRAYDVHPLIGGLLDAPGIELHRRW